LNSVEPRTEEDLECLAQNGLVEESHWLDLKRKLGPGNSVNEDLGKDRARHSHSTGNNSDWSGGRHLTASSAAGPVEELAERIELVARMRVDEAVEIRTTVVDSASNLGHVYVVLHGSQSVRYCTRAQQQNCGTDPI
jgi:hypothetical protein